MLLSGALCCAAIVAPAGSTAAHGFGTSANPDHYIADGPGHTWISVETNASHRNYLDPLFDGRMTGQYGARTDMTVAELTTYINTVDVYWEATLSVTSSDAQCMQWVVYNQICDRVRIRHPESKIGVASANTWRQGMCHEIGHSVGFDDSSPENAIGCMSGGGVGVLSSHEIGHINAQY